MEQQRNILFILFLTLTLFIYWAWERDKIDMEQQAQIQAQRIEQIAAAESTQGSVGKLVNLSSDTLKLAISSVGGDIVDAKLLKVKQEQFKDEPFHLLMNDPLFVYQSQSGLIGANGPDSKARPTWTATADSYELKEGEDKVSAVLHFTQKGVEYTKTYTLTRGSYVVDVKYDVVNNTDNNLSMAFYGQLKQTVDASLNEQRGAMMVAGAYRGTAYSTDETRYEKNTLEDLVELSADKQPLSVPTTGGWVAMIQHYFVSAWIGDTTEGVKNVIFSNSAKKGAEAIIGIRTEPAVIDAHSSHEFKASMWIGPKSQDEMEKVAPNLDLTVDYGWLWFISIPLFKILEFIHGYIGNWGFSIILLTLVVRAILFPLTKAQYTSMAKMRLLAPKMQELRERCGDDRQKLGQETMRLYKSEKVNPLGGCLPLLVQMPIFIALYWTLMESTELRHSPFIFWIKDLSVYDPYFVTPILYGISMYAIQKMSPTPTTDPLQKKVFMAMPLVFTFMFCTFPAGLTIYWLVSNIFTIFQQVIIFKSLEKKGLHFKS
ncbi:MULTISPECIES: membrane protein insertase YidC [unclassified Anaerobiospirillum]|uniref:membrane protein insertase YidC n=1 Tax=unclassified Anaerobiospirillum TaxID=2647410 RepID=UPI001FF65330|nr:MULTISPECIES: membrane protein insertase YidC [unclassified Anaerobiospirillum]MCK0535396.1 membrane protein insertase YidC [Anaerobiospirillum sp. NML120511]MCK0539088.1 membrane protein insertase YidC [Anaerobiospirillum sp. NML02-A-032]